VIFGPVYDTPSKRPFGPPQGLGALETVARAVSRPVLAVGGLTPARVPEVLAAGAAGVAVIGAIYAAARPADATKAFLDALGSA
jgi:thiamine-phosphate pyrophosphorylase